MAHWKNYNIMTSEHIVTY